MTPADPEIAAASASMRHNRSLIERSRECACVHCLTIYEVNENFDWIDRTEPKERWTALCQLCEEPFVIGSASGLPVFKEGSALLNRLYDALIIRI